MFLHFLQNRKAYNVAFLEVSNDWVDDLVDVSPHIVWIASWKGLHTTQLQSP